MIRPAAIYGKFMRVFALATIIPALLLGACSDSSTDPIPVIDATKVEEGSTAPDFTLLDPDGNPISLSDYRGKVVYVEFWATWCSYCMAAMPGLIKVWEEYRDQGFVILGVSLDYREGDWKKYLAQNSDVSWPQVFDPIKTSDSPTLIYGVTGTPSAFLLDEEGVVRQIHRGSIGERKLREEIDALLAE